MHKKTENREVSEKLKTAHWKNAEALRRKSKDESQRQQEAAYKRVAHSLLFNRYVTTAYNMK